MATAFLTAGIFLAPLIAGREPRGQAVLSALLLGAMAVVVFGSLGGEFLSYHNLLPRGLALLFRGRSAGNAVELGRFWMYLLIVGMILWVVYYLPRFEAASGRSRARQPALALSLQFAVDPGFLAVSLLTHTQSTFAIGDFWRFWVVHFWVENFLELFTTMLVALIFVLMGIVSERFATRLIYFDVTLYSIGGVVGTLHHCYFSGGPAVEMGRAFFSAAEVIPLTLLTVEAWSFLQLGTRRQTGGAAAFPHRWAVLFLASVGFWNFLGAGVFGFLINLPVVSYYEIGTLLTSNHGHAAFMGVYGMLALALLVFCTRYLARPEDWSEGIVRFAFWGTNVGLMLMILGHLFPLGVLQLGDVVTNGYWHARTEWFKHYPWLSWARLPGDLVFMAGSAPLVWLTLKVALRTRKTAAPRDQAGTPLEATLYTEITPEGDASRG